MVFIDGDIRAKFVAKKDVVAIMIVAELASFFGLSCCGFDFFMVG